MTPISVNVDVTTVRSCSVLAVPADGCAVTTIQDPAGDDARTAPQRAGADGA
ncbi:hypothetical protein [Streptomyces puniciscabiei]|uniref:hypothetical protein n=1 Tax=Streptomyces puniciscabiei TaxID=164348 RepID=UPI00332D7AAB